MASRLMHLAVSSQLEKVLPIENKNSFRIGQILPDAVLSADKIKVNSHFINVFDGGKRKIFDFFDFYSRYEKEMLSDELYLGYYFHLIEDNIFRITIYYDIGLISRRGDPKLLEELYRDYHILNGIIAEKYSLDSNLYVPQGFSDMTINRLYPFELKEFLAGINEDIKERQSGMPKHFTAEVLDKYISACVNTLTAEYNAIKNGGHHLTRYELSIENRHV